jgi:hypothetical protein
MRRRRRKNATPFRSAACHAPRLRHWHGCPTLTRQAIVAARPASPGSARPGAPSYLIFFPLSCSSPGDRPASPIFADIPQTSASLPGGGSLSGVRPKELEPGGVDTAAQVGLLQESSRSRKALKGRVWPWAAITDLRQRLFALTALRLRLFRGRPQARPLSLPGAAMRPYGLGDRSRCRALPRMTPIYPYRTR